VRDLVAACRAVLEKGDALPRRVYNIGAPQRINRVDMALAVAEVGGRLGWVGVGAGGWMDSIGGPQRIN